MIAALVLTLAMETPPAPSDYVTDSNGALSGAAYKKVESELSAFHDRTSDHVFVYVAATTGDESTLKYTDDTVSRWMADRGAQPDDAVLFVFTKDRRARIVTRLQLKDIVSDDRRVAIANDDVQPALKSGNVDAAVEHGVDALLAEIDRSTAAHDAAPNRSGGFWQGIGSFFVGLGWAMDRANRASRFAGRMIVALVIVGFAGLVVLGLAGNLIDRMRGKRGGS